MTFPGVLVRNRNNNSVRVLPFGLFPKAPPDYFTNLVPLLQIDFANHNFLMAPLQKEYRQHFPALSLDKHLYLNTRSLNRHAVLPPPYPSNTASN